MDDSHTRDFLRLESRCDRAGRFVLSRPRYQGRRPAATPRVRATLAAAGARGLFGYRADFAGRQPRHLLLPAWLAAALDDRDRHALARVSPGEFCIAASSWHTIRWLRDNPWFENEVLPELRSRIDRVVGTTCAD